MTDVPTDVAGAGSESTFARARAGDQAAWAELFHQCYPKVVRVVRRKLNPPMRSLYDSLDFASDVWASLVEKADRFDFPSVDALMAFLAQAAERKVIDEHRRRNALKNDIKREERLDAGGGGSGSRTLPSSDPTPSQVAVATEWKEQLEADRTEEEREIIRMKEYGYENPEIAERTGWHLRAVQRFIKHLRDSALGDGRPRP